MSDGQLPTLSAHTPRSPAAAPCPRSFSRGSVFTAEIVDEQGTAIEATFWRDAADQAYDLLEEGKVGPPCG